MSDTDIDDVLKLIGMGRLQLLMIFACGMVCLLVSNEVIGMFVILVPISNEFQLNDQQRSHLSSAAFLGMIVAAHYWGYKTDQAGRRKMMLYSMGLAIISSVISAFLPNFYWFLLFRFLTGILITGASVNNITYMVEFSSVERRPRMISFITCFFGLGAVYVASVAYFIEPLQRVICSIGNFEMQMWRLNIMINTSPGIIALISMWLLPESAKFMLSINQMQRAYQILDRLCLSNKGRDLQSFGVASVTQSSLRSEQSKEMGFFSQLWYDTIPLFKRPYLWSVLQVGAFLGGLFFVGNGMGMWFMQMRNLMQCNHLTVCEMMLPNKDTSNKTITSPRVDYTDGIAMGLTQLLIFIAITMLLCCFKRRTVLFIFTLSSSLCGLSLNFLSSHYIILYAMIFFIASCACLIGLASSAICDVVPTYMRAKAISVVFMFGRSAAIIASVVIGAGISSKCVLTFNLFVLYAAVCAVLTFFLPA